jgi:hypothetical protein
MGEEALMVGADPRNSQMRSSQAELIGSLIALLIILGICSGFAWIAARNEAAAFNRFTDGPKVTTWDAVWLDLRVEAR